MSTSPLSALAAESYVLLTTFRQSGEAVSTPVWIAESPDGQVLVTTGTSSGKVKRIRNNPRIELVACDARGGIRGDSAPVQARAEIVSDADTRVVTDAALKAKYGIQFTAIRLANKFGSKKSGSVALRLSAVTVDEGARQPAGS
ncbi:PPOX class F420-dependent oxidoreductase [Microterricola viridarii]|uniref:Pyridoxamine 5'-phosphate oxidase N-terminal domain-containing protein n=1 Tax=Microterricola viridarii TaxID=412690 RepID=A0A1H1RFT1_9MICO|nr:PPOX class F420-dependent oxidoreductase [Microterricola viridarii]SDS34647.1 hypothetical protein SAMN04489834_1312 [Microterricola viridarii]